jgi:hypothetical protein
MHLSLFMVGKVFLAIKVILLRIQTKSSFLNDSKNIYHLVYSNKIIFFKVLTLKFKLDKLNKKLYIFNYQPNHDFIYIIGRGDHFRFSFVFIKKKVIKPNFFPGSVRFFRTKTVLTRFFSVWLGFFPVWVRFCFFSFRFIKPNQSVFSKF